MRPAFIFCQTSATYSYDSMNRLSGLTQGEARVGYTYTNDD